MQVIPTAPRTCGETLGHWAAQLDFDDLPREVVERLKIHLLDTLGVGYAFANEVLARELVALAAQAGERPTCTVLGHSLRTSERSAALVNGALMHGLDFDDVHAESITHPSVVVVPAVLALAEATHASGRTALVALAVGIEVCARLGLAGGVAMARNGSPPMSVCGALGAAAAAGRLLGLSGDEIAAAIGIAGSMAAGSHEWTANDSNFKFTTAGSAASAGVLAARMAQGGFNGSRSAIEGRKGLFNAFAGVGNYELDALAAELGDRWECACLTLKVFPSCQGTQSYIDCALRLTGEHRIAPDDVERVTLHIGALVGLNLCEPAALKRDPPLPYSAKFSIPYCVAIALLEGRVELDHFGERWGETHAAVARLAARIDHVVDPAFDASAASQARVTLHLRNGREVTASAETSRGSPARPLTLDEVLAKFRGCTGGQMSAERQDRIAQHVLLLEHEADLAVTVPAWLGAVA